MDRTRTAALLALAIVVTACAQQVSPTGADSSAPTSTVDPAAPSPATDSSADPVASPSSMPSPPTTASDGLAYECGTLALSPQDLDSAPPATELGDDGRAALDGTEVPPIDLDDGWRIIGEGPNELALVRELATPEQLGPGDVRTHEYLFVQYLQEVEDGPAWHLGSVGSCALRRELLDGLQTADLALDPDHPLDPAATTIHLLAIERDCASGQAATGRVEVVTHDLTDDQLQLHVGIRPLEGGAECPGNPPTPFTVELAEPLGGRVPVDIALLPPRPLEPFEAG